MLTLHLQREKVGESTELKIMSVKCNVYLYLLDLSVCIGMYFGVSVCNVVYCYGIMSLVCTFVCIGMNCIWYVLQVLVVLVHTYKYWYVFVYIGTYGV